MVKIKGMISQWAYADFLQSLNKNGEDYVCSLWYYKDDNAEVKRVKLAAYCKLHKLDISATAIVNYKYDCPFIVIYTTNLGDYRLYPRPNGGTFIDFEGNFEDLFMEKCMPNLKPIFNRMDRSLPVQCEEFGKMGLKDYIYKLHKLGRKVSNWNNNNINKKLSNAGI